MAMRDVFLVMVVVFALSIAGLATHSIVNSTVTQLQANPTINSSNSTMQALSAIEPLTNKIDYIIFGVFVGFLMAIIITAWLVAGFPMFKWIFVIGGVIAVIASMLMSNIFGYIVDNHFITEAIHFPLTRHLLGNFPVYIAVTIFIAMIVLFAKPNIAGDVP